MSAEELLRVNAQLRHRQAQLQQQGAGAGGKGLHNVPFEEQLRAHHRPQEGRQQRMHGGKAKNKVRARLHLAPPPARALRMLSSLLSACVHVFVGLEVFPFKLSWATLVPSLLLTSSLFSRSLPSRFAVCVCVSLGSSVRARQVHHDVTANFVLGQPLSPALQTDILRMTAQVPTS